MLSPLAFELAFVLGLLFGSFLNVCISRLPKHESLWKPRSHCPNCHATIRWYDNIPLLSWVLLRAKVPGVQAADLVAISGGGVCFRTGARFALPSAALALFALSLLDSFLVSAPITALLRSLFAILGFLLIGLLVMDWQTHTLPDAFTLTGTLLGFLLLCVRAAYLPPHAYELLLHGRNPLTSVGGAIDNGNVVLTGPEHLVLGRLLGITVAAGLLLLIRFLYKQLRHREGLGLGDVKLVAMITAFLGFWPAAFAIFLGFVLCAATPSRSSPAAAPRHHPPPSRRLPRHRRPHRRHPRRSRHRLVPRSSEPSSLLYISPGPHAHPLTKDTHAHQSLH
jgi:leader peptidase (prepilin peptidase)/N-methyltransferase